VKDRFLLDRIHIQRDGSSKDEGIQLSFPILPDSTDPSFGGSDGASVIAEMAPDLSSLQGMIEHSFFHDPFSSHEVRSFSKKSEDSPLKVDMRQMFQDMYSYCLWFG
jgi:hypothetical protein